MDYFYYNLSNINERNGKLYFLLSRQNKDGNIKKTLQSWDINSPTIQSLIQTLHLSSIKDLILLDDSQENEVNVLNIGVLFNNGGIDWSVVAKGRRQSYFGPFIFPQDWLDKHVGEEIKKVKVDEYKKEESFMGSSFMGDTVVGVIKEEHKNTNINTNINLECPCSRKLKMPFWDDEDCNNCKDKRNHLDNIDKWTFLIPKTETKEEIKERRERDRLLTEVNVNENGDILYKNLPNKAEKELNFDTNVDGSKNYKITNMSDLDSISDNDYIILN